MEKSTNYWESLSKKIESPGQTKNKRPDTSDLEIDFLTKFIKNDADVIDIGSGSGLITNKLIDKVRSITAVEKFEGFTKFIIDTPSMLVINADIIGFKMRKQFDAALCLGVAQCFTKDATKDIYNNLFEMLKQQGVLIVRMHCGIKEDVIVDGFSEELQTNYYAEYRQIDSEVELLKQIGFLNIEVHDIFPDTLNVWDNTRHYMMVCYK